MSRNSLAQAGSIEKGLAALGGRFGGEAVSSWEDGSAIAIQPEAAATESWADQSRMDGDILTFSAVAADGGALLAADATASVATLTFQNGANGYTGTVDTGVSENSPNSTFGSATSLSVDNDTPGGSGKDTQALLRFDNIFGTGASQIPVSATILSATLTLNTTNSGGGASIHRMLIQFDNSITWNSSGSGIQTDGSEAAAAADASLGQTGTGPVSIDVTASLQAWASGQANYGWVFAPVSSDGWDFSTSEGAIKPLLEVQFSVDGSTNFPPVASDDSAATQINNPVNVPVLSNDSDPNGDALTITGVTDPAHGSAAIGSGGIITYTPANNYTGADAFDYTVTDGQYSDTARVSVTVAAQGSFADSYIATAGLTGPTRNFEHDNASKSFYHDGHWWAVIQDGSTWSVHKFTGSPPAAGQVGGWVKASSNFQSGAFRTDVAFDDANDKAYVLNFSGSQTKAYIYKLGYNSSSDTWTTEATIQLSGAGGKLSGLQWQKNSELALGLDANGMPVVAAIGPSGAGGNKGLHLAYATSSNLSSWSDLVVDSGTTSAGGNGNSKADLVSFTQNGVKKIGILYSAENGSNDSWKIAYHDATPGTNYGSGWTVNVINSSVSVDNHISAVSDGNTIWFAMKDANDTIWVEKGVPGAWSAPVKAVQGDPSRPTLVLDDTHDKLYLFYQQHTSNPYGSIYMKETNAFNLSFNSGQTGTLVMTTNGKGDLIDPQGPAQVVGSQTGGEFILLAKNQDVPADWYNDIILA
jgi:hypothetical protein